MLAKGTRLPQDDPGRRPRADNALYSAEFRATERLFALLEQVAGRAGRGELAGEVLVQTDFPDHPLYRALVGHDYDRYAETLLAERQNLGLPPFAHLALLAAEAKARTAVTSFLEAASERGRAVIAAHACRCELYPPLPAGLARRAGMERGRCSSRATTGARCKPSSAVAARARATWSGGPLEHRRRPGEPRLNVQGDLHARHA